jgi:hypothetical protein
MNSRTFNLGELELDINEIKSVLKAIVHTIMFNRNTKVLVVPRTCSCYEFQNLQYAMIDNIKLTKEVNDKVDKIYNILMEHGTVVCGIVLYTKTITKGWFSNNEKLNEWERWVLPIKLSRGHIKNSLITRENKIKHEISKIFVGIDNNIETPDSNNELYPFDIININEKSLFDNVIDAIKQGPPKFFL